MDCFTLVDRPRPGWENMGLDDFMLEQAAERSRLCVRLYRWANPTLSLGYFQPYADRELHAPSANLDVVRRATGGGAIVHHH